MLRVMTMNMNYFVPRHGAWEIRREMISNAIRRGQPDVVSLQAVRMEPGLYEGKNAAAQLQDLLPEYSFVDFQAAFTHPDGSVDGSAFLSRLPFAATKRLELTLLPGLDDSNHRLVLQAQFDLPEGPFHLFNAHFSWVEEQAALNMDESLAFMSRFTGPAALTGDLNTPAGSSLWQPLKAAGWTDAWEKLCLGANGYTFESNNPNMRIDYIWANESLAPALRKIEIIANEQHASGARPSDHYGLLAEFQMGTS